MAKTIAELERNVTNTTATLFERVASLRKDLDDLEKRVDNLTEAMHQMRSEMELLKHRLESHLDRVEKWDGRVWGLIILLLTLAAGLIVAIVKK